MNRVDTSAQIIVIDDEAVVRDSVTQTFELEGYRTIACEDPKIALSRCSMTWPGVIVCDVRMEIMDGLEVLQQILNIDAEIPVIMFSAQSDIAVAVRAIQMGAYDFLEKTEDPQHHLDTVRRALNQRHLILENRDLRKLIDGQHEISNRIVGQTGAVRQLRETVLQLAQVDVDLIIHGHTGTGKEVVARCLHDFGARAQKPFMAINCGALADSVIESELFGHEAGAFTGAQKRRIGKIEYAAGGTLFLDEIESMPPSLQVRLLRVLQERSLQRLGGNEEIQVDVRVVAASKVNLADSVASGAFREDLFYRLNVATIELPDLDRRKADIPLLFRHFVELASRRYGRDGKAVPEAVLTQLARRDWPGNVRELRNVAERWALGLALESSDFDPADTTDAGLDEQLARFEREVIVDALIANQGHAAATAETLGIPRKKLYLRMKKHGIVRSDYSSSD